MIGNPPVAIDQPLRFGVDGSLVTTQDVSRQILQRLVTIVATNPTERIMRPEFGVGAAKMVFEPDPSAVVAELSIEVDRQAALYEPGAVITRIDPHPDATKGMSMMDIYYVRTDTPETGVEASRFVNTASVGPGGIVYEVIRG